MNPRPFRIGDRVRMKRTRSTGMIVAILPLELHVELHPAWPLYRERRVAVIPTEIELAPLPTARELALRR